MAANRATVNVNVLRNEQAPIFFPRVYNVTIREDKALNTEVVVVAATDGDTNVSLSLLFSDSLFDFSLRHTCTQTLYIMCSTVNPTDIICVHV